jgi:hypothetical protein
VLSLKAFDRAHIVVCDSRRILVTTEYDGDDGDGDDDDNDIVMVIMIVMMIY